MNTQPWNTGWQARWFNFVLWLAILTGLVLFLRAVQPILLPFALGTLIAYLMNPPTLWLERRGLSRTQATALVTLVFFSTLIGLVVWLVPVLIDQINSLAARAPGLIDAVNEHVRSLTAPFIEKLNMLNANNAEAIPTDTSIFTEHAMAQVGNFVRNLFSSGAAFINLAALLLLTPMVCFYLIRDWPSVMRRADALLPRAYAPVIREQLQLINKTLSAYLRGQLTVMAILSLYYVAMFLIFRLHFGLALGVLAGCVVIIPYVGLIISLSLGLIVAHSQFGTTTDFFLVLGVYGFGTILEQQILTPKIIGDRIGLHPLWLLFGMLAGAVLFGFVGILLAVPLTAVIGVLTKFAIGRYLQSGLYLDQ